MIMISKHFILGLLFLWVLTAGGCGSKPTTPLPTGVIYVRPTLTKTATPLPTITRPTSTPLPVTPTPVGPMITATSAPVEVEIAVNHTPTEVVTNAPTLTPFSAIGNNPRIVFQSNRDGDFEIFIMDLDGSNQIQLTHNDRHDNFPAASPDGTKIAFQSERDGNIEIYVMDINGNNQLRLTEDPADDELPNWSPDSQKIVFTSKRDGDHEIFIMDADGNHLRQVTDNDDLVDGHVSWSVDNLLVFNSGTEDGRTWDIFTMDIYGNNLQQLTSNRVSDWSPEWSPDGQSILYLSAVRQGDPGIMLMDRDGGNSHLLLNHPEYEWGPRWSSNGRQIVFTVNIDEISYIYMMEADGGDVSSISARGSYPSWMP